MEPQFKFVVWEKMYDDELFLHPSLLIVVILLYLYF